MVAPPGKVNPTGQRAPPPPGQGQHAINCAEVAARALRNQGTEGQYRGSPQHGKEVIHQRSRLPFCPARMAIGGFAVMVMIGYFTLYVLHEEAGGHRPGCCKSCYWHCRSWKHSSSVRARISILFRFCGEWFGEIHFVINALEQTKDEFFFFLENIINSEILKISKKTMLMHHHLSNICINTHVCSNEHGN